MWDILAWIFPKKCVGCNRSGAYLCPQCLTGILYLRSPICPGCGKPIDQLSRHPGCKTNPALDGLIALGRYEGVLKRLIKQIKYSGYFDMVRETSQFVVTHFPHELAPGLVVTCVPLHPHKLRQRGFNQSELLAKELAKRLGIPFRALLMKPKATPSQAHLKRQQRLTNLKHAFEAIPTSPKKVLLVDDVTTTRTTLNECAAALKRAGTQTVFGLVLAYSE